MGLIHSMRWLVKLSSFNILKDSASIILWATYQIPYTLSPSNSSNKKIYWSSSDTSIATVDGNWIVTAVAVGTCTITGTTDYLWLTDTISMEITVIHPTWVTLNTNSITLEAWQTSQLTATVSPNDATNKNVTWSSSNTSVATVSSTGLVTYVSDGTATITVTTVDWNKTATCSVVCEDTPVLFLEYIESTWTQWINTLYTPSVNTEIETEISWWTQSTEWWVFFWVTNNDTSSNWLLWRIYSSTSTTFNPWFYNSSYSECQISASLNTFHKIILKKNYCTLDWVAWSMTTSWTPYQNYIYLFCWNNSWSAWRYTSCKIKSFKISESWVLKKEFIPCINKQWVIGMRDNVNKVFYSNQWSGTFIKWPEAPKLSQIQEVQYIEWNWTQWIDTLVTAKHTTKSQIKVRPLWVTGNTIYWYCYTDDNADYRLFNYSSQIYWDLSNQRVYWSTFSSWNDYSFEIWNNYVKNIWASSNILTWSTVSSYTSAWTIKLNYHDNWWAISSNRWYFVKIREWNTQIRDFIPCYVKLTWTIWLFDKINNKFYVNQWSWTFTKWPDV